MKLVLDNIIFFLQRAGGVSVYWSENISRLDRSGHEIEYLEPKGLFNNISYNPLRPILTNKISTEFLSAKPLSFLPYRKSFSEKFLFHSSYYRVATSPLAVNIVTIHDFMPELFFPRWKKEYHSFRKRRAIERAHGIVCVSHNTAADLAKFYPTVDAIPVTVIHLGVKDDYRLLPRERKSDPPFILYVGRRGNYKNFKIAVEALASLPGYHMKVVGDAFTSEESKLIERVNDRVELLLNPSNEKLNKLYNDAWCLVYPSAYEGFGIPVVEAMRSGCPVIAANKSSIPEIAGASALLLDEVSPRQVIEAVRKLEDAAFREQLIRQGFATAKKFDWDESYSKLLSFYELVYDRTEKMRAR